MLSEPMIIFLIGIWRLILEGCVCADLFLDQFSPILSTKFKIYVMFSSWKKHAVWGWETEKHVLSSCAMLACCEYSTNIKWLWNMNWWVMNHFRELSCQNVLEDPWNIWQIQRIPRFAFAEIYLFIWGDGETGSDFSSDSLGPSVRVQFMFKSYYFNFC